jgi:hypothetical protein
VYDFDELSDEAKQKAIRNLSDINVNYDWWRFQYDDALEIGLKINWFDIERYSYMSGELICSAMESIKKVLENHGPDCETTKTAQCFLDLYNQIEPEMRDDDWLSDFECDYLDAICDCYLTLLREEYEYQTSEEAIIETILANEYTFLPDGTMKNF